MTEDQLLELSANELRTTLVTLGMSPYEANEVKGKNNLRTKIRGLTTIMPTELPVFDIDEEDDEDDLVEEAAEAEDEHEEEKKINITSPEWHDHVMSHFVEDELVTTASGDKLPKLTGLRRVAQKLIGRITDNQSCIVGFPSMENNFMAIGQSEITIEAKNHYLTYKEVADCTVDNTDPPFNKNLTATAASKAEARNLRKILQLKSIAAEEYTQKTAVVNDTAPSRIEGGEEESFAGPTEINETQIALIDKLCGELNIDAMKFINQKDKQYSKITEVASDVAISMCVTLHKYRNKEDGYQNVPENLVGYQKGWSS